MTRSKNMGEYPPTLDDLERLRPLRLFFQVIRGGRAAPPIGGSKGGAVFVLVLKKLLAYVLFAATREVNLYSVARQGAVENASKYIAKSVINR